MEWRWAWGATALVAGLAATMAVEHWRATRIEDDLVAHYQQIANDRVESEIAVINRSLSALDALQAFLDAAPAPVPRDFTRFAVTQKHLPGVDAVFVAESVETDGRAGFENHWREYYPGFAIRDRATTQFAAVPAAHAAYLPIIYGAFTTPATLGIGQDLTTQPDLLRELNDPSIDGPVFSPWLRNDNAATSMLVLRWRVPRATGQVLGLTLSPQGVIDSMPEMPQLRDVWQDNTDATRPSLLYPAGSERVPPHLRQLATRELRIGGRRWQLQTRLDPLALEDALSTNRIESWTVGALLSLLLMVVASTRLLTHREARRTLAAQNTLLCAQLEDTRVAHANARRDGIRLKTILDTAGEAIVLIDETGRIELFNIAAENMFGYEATAVEGLDVGLLITPSYRNRIKDALRQSGNGQSLVERDDIRELLALKKDGAAFPIDLSLNEFRLDEGRYFVAVIRDVTDRKRAERMLFESEYKHRAILDAAHIGIYLLQDGMLRYVNPAFAASFARMPDEFVDKARLSELVVPAWAEALQVALDPDRSGGRPTEVLMHRDDGTRFYALLTAKPIIFDNRPGLAGSLLDISERKAAEEAMLRAEIRNIAILEAIPDLMLQLDASGIVIDCRARSGGAEFGLAPDCVGQHYRRGLPLDFSSPLDETLAEGWPARLRTFEYSLATELGIRHFEARVTPASDGEWLVMVRDISERKLIEAELIRHRDHLAELVRERTAELNTLFSASPLPTAFLSQRRFIEVNNAFETLFGYPKEVVIGETTQMFLSDEAPSRDISAEVYAKLAAGGLAQVELRYRAANGRSVLCEAFGKAIDPSNPLAASIWVYQDIGERRAAEEALKSAKELAEAASRAKSEFLANMSHELRTPMHAVLSFAELGERKALASEPGKLMHYFSRIRSSGQRLLQILNDLLDLSKLEAGKMQYEMRPLAFNTLINEVTEEFAPLARSNALQFHLDIAQDLPEVHGDALRLGQVLRNLVANAIKFSPDGGQICLSARQYDHDWLEIAVEDEGVGIPSNELATIFDKFTQSSKTKTGAGGTGLGLAISREIVAAHAGHIRALNRAEGGACFVITLPIHGPRHTG